MFYEMLVPQCWEEGDDESEESSNDLHDMVRDIGVKFHAKYEADATGDDEVPRVDLHCRVDKDTNFMKL